MPNPTVRTLNICALRAGDYDNEVLICHGNHRIGERHLWRSYRHRTDYQYEGQNSTFGHSYSGAQATDADGAYRYHSGDVAADIYRAPSNNILPPATDNGEARHLQARVDLPAATSDCPCTTPQPEGQEANSGSTANDSAGAIDLCDVCDGYRGNCGCQLS